MVPGFIKLNRGAKAPLFIRASSISLLEPEEGAEITRVYVGHGALYFDVHDSVKEIGMLLAGNAPPVAEKPETPTNLPLNVVATFVKQMLGDLFPGEEWTTESVQKKLKCSFTQACATINALVDLGHFEMLPYKDRPANTWRVVDLLKDEPLGSGPEKVKGFGPNFGKGPQVGVMRDERTGEIIGTIHQGIDDPAEQGEPLAHVEHPRVNLEHRSALSPEARELAEVMYRYPGKDGAYIAEQYKGYGKLPQAAKELEARGYLTGLRLTDQKPYAPELTAAGKAYVQQLLAQKLARPMSSADLDFRDRNLGKKP